ncbi:unnamed protein product [Darwinula stevensoni]|uniref:Uncharacterized protein n=1 Tax=Darwinula stevensoni TaxID=69355 RepID=A0A7R9AH14_9CRUS|nr:unnamed protein product [Darwinula stevensoni]CAG0904407.1 unnamed protein product [Darwinula stevensoni]
MVWSCSNPNANSSCSCFFDDSSGEVTVDCSRASSGEEIFSAFNNYIWLSTLLVNYGGQRRFLMTGNWAVEELAAGVFGNVTFDHIFIWGTNLVTVDSSAVLSSKDRLEQLTIANSLLGDFPFQILPQMTQLRGLQLDSNLLKSVPALKSQSLQNLSLSLNQIETLESGWSVPNLEILNISYNPISQFPSRLVDGMVKLNFFSASGCNVGPTLSSGSLSFHSNALQLVSLGGNNIARLEAGAITGLGVNTTFLLHENNIKVLTEDSFEPIFETLSLGNGKILLLGNPIQCNTGMSWLLLHPNAAMILKNVTHSLECAKGTSLLDLLLLRFLNNVLPFQWVNSVA